MNERERKSVREIFTMDKDIPRSTRLWIRTVVGKKSNGPRESTSQKWSLFLASPCERESRNRLLYVSDQ